MHDPLPENSHLRKLWLGDADLYRAHLLRLDAESRRARFGGTVSDDAVGRYASGSIGSEAVLHGFFADGVLRGAAELRPIRSGMRAGTAEASFSIEQPWQSHGVGSALLAHVLLAARNRGIGRLHMVCLADNQRMQQLARKFDAVLSFDYGSVIGAVVTPYPTPMSVMSEAVSDAASFANAIIDMQARFLKA